MSSHLKPENFSDFGMDVGTSPSPQEETQKLSDFGMDGQLSPDVSKTSGAASPSPRGDAQELNDFGMDSQPSPGDSETSAAASPSPRGDIEELNDFGMDIQPSPDDSEISAGAFPSPRGEAEELSDYGMDSHPSADDSGTGSVEPSFPQGETEELRDYGMDSQPSPDDSGTNAGVSPSPRGETEELNDFGMDDQPSPEGLSDSGVDWNVSRLPYGDSWEDAPVSLSLHSGRVGRLTNERTWRWGERAPSPTDIAESSSGDPSPSSHLGDTEAPNMVRHSPSGDIGSIPKERSWRWGNRAPSPTDAVENSTSPPEACKGVILEGSVSSSPLEGTEALNVIGIDALLSPESSVSSPRSTKKRVWKWGERAPSESDIEDET